jgi:hypothetical protein
MNKITAPAPKFNQYEFVTVHWDGETETQIVRRWLDYDDGVGSWWYEVRGSEQKYPESALEARIATPNPT